MSRRRPTPALAATFLAVALLFCAATAQGQSLVLSNLVVDNQSGALSARFGVSVDSVAEISDALTNGVTLGLGCKARLTRSGGLLSGPQVAAAEMTSRLKYDSLTKEFVLTLPRRDAPLKNPRLDELLRQGWGDLSLSMGSWSDLARGAEYTLTLDIRLQQVDIPNWFRRTLFFWAWDMAPQASYQLHF
jgi:hypothetical protein